MKKRIVVLLISSLLPLLIFTGCNSTIHIRFVDANGNDLFTDYLCETSGSETNKENAEPTSDTKPDKNTSIAESHDSAVHNENTSVENMPSDITTEPATINEFGIPSTKEEILSFYRNAVSLVKNENVGYSKKTWESAGADGLIGIPAIDSFIQKEVEKRATSETEAETKTYKKGTPEAKEMFPDCTLSDIDKIESAVCEKKGNNYFIKIIMTEEDTPKSIKNSMLGQITDIILFQDEIERNLSETLPVVKNYQFNLVYKAFEVTCELTPNGQFLYLQHHATGNVHISTVQILFITLKDKDATITMDASFTDFRYSE